MDTNPRFTSEEFTSSSGKVWTVCVDTEADNGGLTDEEAEAMVIAAADRAEEQAKKLYGD